VILNLDHEQSCRRSEHCFNSVHEKTLFMKIETSRVYTYICICVYVCTMSCTYVEVKGHMYESSMHAKNHKSNKAKNCELAAK